MIHVEVPRVDAGGELTLQGFQKAILGIPNLPDGPKGMVADLFKGATPPTDGDTFVTFEDPKGGFFTVDRHGHGVVVAWHENTQLVRGSVEAVLVGNNTFMYREHFNCINGGNRSNVLVGKEAIPKIESFYARRLRGE